MPAATDGTRRLGYIPRSQFLPFHLREQRWSCIVAHRRCGKTVATINELIIRALLTPKSDGRYAYIAPFRSQAKAVAWDYLKRHTLGITKDKEVREADLQVELLNGSRIRLYGSDNPHALRGLYLDGCVLDEFADMRPSVWGEVVRPMLADRRGWATFIGTPRGKNSFWAIHDHAQRSPEWFSLVLKAHDTGLIEPAELADARRTMTDDQFEQEFGCSFDAAVQGAFYGREMREVEAQGRIGEVRYETLAPVHTAWDLGYSDDTAIWFWQVVAGEVRLIDYYASNGEGVEHYCRLIQSKPYQYGNHWVPHDAVPKTLAANGRSIIQQMHALGVKARVAPDLGVQDGIQAVRLMLPRCWFDAAKCSEGIEALKQYRREFDEDRKAFRDKPRHDWCSHASDSFRYLALVWREEHKPEKPEPKIRTIHDATLDELWDLQRKQTGKRI
jgi:phage terminase large subunit